MIGPMKVGGTVPPTFDLVWEAARLLALGLNPIPIQAETKKPVIRWKEFQDTRFVESDMDMLQQRLERWWGRTDHQLAVLTGAPFNLVVVDVDDVAARRLVLEHVDRGTVAARTRKGFHIWYQHPGDRRPNRVGVAGVRLDVRGDGGYVVVPPSWGRTWLVSPWQLWPPAPMPESLVELCWPRPRPRIAIRRPPRTDTVSTRYVQVALDRETAAVAQSREPGRNAQLNRSAFALGRFVRSGLLSESEISSALLDAARMAGLEDEEAEPTIRSGLRAHRG